uniref:Uncharacterized protein n=1 Tax=Anguilla anguilla TaxID=7936 RepID=A0A0E9WUZ2_ANGAN
MHLYHVFTSNSCNSYSHSLCFSSIKDINCLEKWICSVSHRSKQEI